MESTFNKNKDYDFFKYPVFYQQQNGYLVFVCPDLNIAITTDLPFKGRYDVKYAVKLSKAMLKVELKIRARLKAMKKARIKSPAPSRTKEILSDTKIKKLTAPQVAQMIGKSADTVRRMSDRGDLPCFKSEGGTRYFLEKDILDFI